MRKVLLTSEDRRSAFKSIEYSIDKRTGISPVYSSGEVRSAVDPSVRGRGDSRRRTFLMTNCDGFFQLPRSGLI